MGRAIFNWVCHCFFATLFVFKSKLSKHQSLYVFDLDNTLGDTYPTLIKTYSSEKERLLSIPVFPKLKRVVQMLMQSPSRQVVFLTARSYKVWFTTQQWLQQNGIDASLCNIVIVQKPMDKIELLQKILPRNKTVYLIDDMTWNHEKGDMKFYETEIQLLSKLPVRYIGYQTIHRHQSKL